METTSRTSKRKEEKQHSKTRLIKSVFVSALILLIFLFVYNEIIKSITNDEVINNVLAFIMIILCIGFINATIYIFNAKMIKYHKLFLIVIVPLSISYNLLIIPGMVPDENTHMKYTYSLSSQILGEEQDGKLTLRAEENYILKNLPRSPNINNYHYSYTHLLSPEDNGEYIKTDENSSDIKRMFGYFPAVLGVTFGRIMHFGATPTFYIGRLMNSFVSLLLIYFAIKRIPFGKQLMLGISLLPIVLQEINSLSYDSILISCSFMIISYGIDLAYNRNKVDSKELMIFLTMGLILVSLKYAIYAFLLFIPIFSKYKLLDENKSIAHKQKIIIMLGMVISIVLMYFIQFPGKGSTETVAGSTVNRLSGNPTGTLYSLTWVLSHPLDTVLIFINSTIENFSFYCNSMLGTRLAWFTITLKDYLAWIWFVILIVCSLKKEPEKYRLNGKTRFLYVLISIIIYSLVLLSMLLVCTPLTSNIILGVQGRYFLPILFLIMILFNNKKIFVSEKASVYTNFAIMAISTLSIVELITTCF